MSRLLLMTLVLPLFVFGQSRPRPDEPVEAAIRQHAAMANIFRYTGEPVGHHANPSVGNKADGNGYFMTGSRSNSFFYYVGRSRRVYANWGPIRDKFAQAGYEFGTLGWPSDDEYLLPDGTGFFQRFDHGWVYWNPRFGACIVRGMIFDHWAKNLWERGIFGYPAGDEVFYPNSAAAQNNPRAKEVYISWQPFENGKMIYLYDKVARQYKILSELKDPNFNPSHPH